jgi:hypothetical protein
MEYNLNISKYKEREQEQEQDLDLKNQDLGMANASFYRQKFETIDLMTNC